MATAQTARSTRVKSNARNRNWKPEFLKAFEETGVISTACAAAAVGRSTVRYARQSDEEFAVAMHDASEAFTENLEREGYRRAVDGSDRLIEFFLRARKPQTYRDNVKVEHSGSVKHDLSGMSIEELSELDARLSR